MFSSHVIVSLYMKYKAFYLPCGCVSPEIGKLSCKPVVDLIEGQLSIRGLQNGLKVVRHTTRFRGECRWREEMANLVTERLT